MCVSILLLQHTYTLEPTSGGHRWTYVKIHKFVQDHKGSYKKFFFAHELFLNILMQNAQKKELQGKHQENAICHFRTRKPASQKPFPQNVKKFCLKFQVSFINIYLIKKNRYINKQILLLHNKVGRTHTFFRNPH